MKRAGTQPTLFDTSQSLPNGFVYRPDFLTKEEETVLIGYIEDLPLVHATQGEYIAKRRLMNFGWSFGTAYGELIAGPSLPPFLRPLQRKVAKWLDIPAHCVVEALITEYSDGAAIGWHCDNEPCESIVGISLSGWCSLRLRPLRSRLRTRSEVISLPVERRSVYVMQHESRWLFQHSVAPVEALRYSITLRTLSKEAYARAMRKGPRVLRPLPIG
jgi:alkylated DNA repair dioxygenase AlkB